MSGNNGDWRRTSCAKASRYGPSPPPMRPRCRRMLVQCESGEYDKARHRHRRPEQLPQLDGRDLRVERLPSQIAMHGNGGKGTVSGHGRSPARTCRTRSRAQRSARVRRSCARQLRRPTEPVLSIMADSSRVRRTTSASSSGTPAQAQTARVRITRTSSNRTTSEARAHSGRRRRHSATTRSFRRDTEAGATSDRNGPLRRRCASPSSICTLPKSWSSFSTVIGIAPTRVKLSPP